MTEFEKRQYKRVSARRQHQRQMHKLMIKKGGYNSLAWHAVIGRIKYRIIRQLQIVEARKVAKASNA